jgi:hypothetical protein
VGKLSNVQSRRLAGILAVLAGKEPRSDILGELVRDRYVEDGKLTQRGLSERERLLTLVGLNAERK